MQNNGSTVNDNNSLQPVKRTTTLIRTKAPVVKLKAVTKKRDECRQCKNLITNANPILICKSCGKRFCETCEKEIEKQDAYIDGDKKYQLAHLYPLCSDCYKLSTKKQIERITLNRRFKQLNESLPQNPEVWFGTGERFIKSEMFHLAAMCFREALKMDSKLKTHAIQTWKELGKDLLSRSRTVEAVHCLDEILLLDDGLVDVWLQRGKILEQLGRDNEAIASYNKIIEMDNKNVEAFIRKGFLKAKAGDKKAFDACFTTAIRIEPEHELLWLLKAKGHLVLKEYNDSLMSSERLLKIKPNNIEVSIIKCKTLLNLERYHEALATSEKVLKIEPQNILCLKLKADTLYHLGKGKDAVQLYVDVLKSDPDEKFINISEVQDDLKRINQGQKKPKPMSVEVPQQKTPTTRELTPEETHLRELDREKREKEERRRIERKAEEVEVDGEFKDEEKADIQKEELRKETLEKLGKIDEIEEIKEIVKIEKIERMPTLAQLKELYEQLQNLEGQKLDESTENEIKGFIKDQSKLLKSELQELRSSGLLISHLIKLYKEAGVKFKKENYLEAIRIIIEIIERKDEYEKELIDDELKKLSTKLNEIGTLFPTNALNTKLNQLKNVYNDKDFSTNYEEIMALKKQIALTEKYFPKAKQLITGLEQKIASLERSGFKIAAATEILGQMKECFNSNDYQTLPRLKNECLKAIEGSRDIYKKLLEEIKDAQKNNELLKSQGINDNECKQLLKKAKMLVISGDYDQAQELITKCVERSQNLIKK